MRLTQSSLAIVVLSSGIAYAQAPPAAPTTATSPQPVAPAQPAPPPGTTAGGTGQPGGPAAPPGAPADPGAKKDAKKPVIPATGYGYKDPVSKGGGRGAPILLKRRAGAPVATLPGFEMLPDGGSRLFVDLSGEVPVEEKAAEGATTYVLRGATVAHRNNLNALMTVHFNTPVWRARLVPSGADLHFVVELREKSATGALKINKNALGAARMIVDFPKGDFLPKNIPDPAPPKDKKG